ncbi:hypothetical protein [Vibrio phage RYC]|nr:hypothetical protein [Vibrio phage RYC]
MFQCIKHQWLLMTGWLRDRAVPIWRVVKNTPEGEINDPDWIKNEEWKTK